MKKLILLVLFILAVTFIIAAEPVAYLVRTRGSVEMHRDNKSMKFRSGQLLFNNDEIITNANGFAVIRYADGAGIVKIFPNSVLVLSVAKQDSHLNKNPVLNLGSIFSRISTKIKGTYKTETPNTVASVRGTEFITRYLADKRTIVIVTEGEVLVLNKISGKSVLVKQGETAVSDETGVITVNPTEPGEITEAEQNEIASADIDSQKTIRVQVSDENGNVKYIDIKY